MKPNLKDRTSGRMREVGAWSEQTSSSGKKYYYNHETEVSQWEKPNVWREYERKIIEEKEKHRHQHDNVKPSTSNCNAVTREVPGNHSSPFQTRNGCSSSRSKDRDPSTTGVDGPPPTKKPYVERISPQDTSTMVHHSLTPFQVQTPSSGVTPLLPQAPPPPVVLQDALTSRYDEPMDVANSPPLEVREAKSAIQIPIPAVRAFDEGKYQLFYKPSNGTLLRKSLGTESTQTELKKTQEKLHKSRMALMELETSIISVQSLLFTAQAKSTLLSEKYCFLSSQIEAIRNTQGNYSPSPLKMKEVNGTKDDIVPNGHPL